MTIFARARDAILRGLKADEVLNDSRGWAINLAVFRIVFLYFCVLPRALRFLRWTVNILPGYSRVMWVPVSFYRLLPLGLLANARIAHWLAIANVVLIVLGIVGFWTRSSIGLSALISLYGFGLMENFGKVDHFHHLIWFLALLAAGPSGHFLSIDSLSGAVKSADRGAVELAPPPFAALWTLRYTWLMMGALYLGTGIAKLQSSLANQWAGSTNLRNIIWRDWLELYWFDPHPTTWVRADLLPGWILAILGASVVALEIGFIFAVLFRKVRPALGLWHVAFHLGNDLVLQIWFTLIPASVCLFDWTAMGRILWHRGRDPLQVFYDAQCGFCRRTVAILRVFDVFDVLRPIASPPEAPSRSSYLQITDEMLARDLYAAAGGRIARGFDAYAWIAKRVFLLWPVAVIMRLPLVAALGRRIYRRAADSRHCTLAPLESKEPAASRRPELALVHRLGLVMLACQLGISGFMLLYNLRDVYLPANVPRLRGARWLVNGIGKRQPEWPFDLYPTYTPATAPDVYTWEARWVTSDGQEIQVSPNAYFKAFGNPGLSWSVVTGLYWDPDSVEVHERSLNLVRLLWSDELPGIRKTVTAVDVYRAEYKLEAPSDRFPAAVIQRSMLYTFPMALLLEPAASASPDRVGFFRYDRNDPNAQRSARDAATDTAGLFE
jgi:predicted DCC family thiol-disulfide oxidoreductase YuxK